MADIIIVDDDVMLQKMLVTQLQRSGHQASCALATQNVTQMELMLRLDSMRAQVVRYDDIS